MSEVRCKHCGDTREFHRGPGDYCYFTRDHFAPVTSPQYEPETTEEPAMKPKMKVIQIAVDIDADITALCDDGSIWVSRVNSSTKKTQWTEIPGPERVAESAPSNKGQI